MGGNKINYSSQSSGDETPDFDFWVDYLLSKPNLSVAPVSSFPHAPLTCSWDLFAQSNIIVEKKLNPNLGTDTLSEGCTEDAENSYWLARVISYSGYFAKVIYERFEEKGFGTTSKQSDRHYDSWANFCTDIQRVGYCANNNFPLVPPQLAMGGYHRISPNSWRNWFLRKVTGAPSKDSQIGRLLEDHFQNQLEVGTTVEALDLNNTSRMRVAKVKKVIGHRILVKYWDADKMNRNYVKSFWASFDQTSDLIYPAGWSAAVGQEIRAPPNYEPPELLPTHSSLSKGLGLDHIDIRVGMKLEAVNVFEPSGLSASTVVKVLKYGYFMVRIDGTSSNNSKSRSINSWYCFHLTSPVIFPCGWCKSHKIDLVPPSREISGTNQHFNWKTYFEKTGTKPLPLEELPKKEVNHGFVAGQKLEAVDLRTPNLICVATISRVVDGLLRIHFDAWNEMYDNWVSVISTDIYPIGYCQLVNHPLQKPPIAISSSSNRRTNKSILFSNNS